jgi:hypothetical protein
VSAPDAQKTFTAIGGRMAELDRSLQKTREISIGDRDAMAKMARLQLQADRFRDRIKSMPLTLEGGAKAEATLLGLEASADRLDRKLGGRGIGGGGRGGILGLLSGIGGAAGSAGQGIGGFLSAAGPAAQSTAVGAGAAGIAALGPAAIPAALGAGLGGLGAFLAAGKQIGKIFADAFKLIKAAVAPLRPLFVAVFQPLTGLARSIGPALRDVFAVSVPYLQTFVGLLKPAAKILLPAISQSLRQFQPFLPLIATGLLRVVKGFAGLLNALGPRGMEDATKIFVTATKVIEFALVATGKVMNALAVGIVVGVHDIAKWWDWMRHHTATVFDGLRHDVAHYWDLIWNNSIGTVIRLGHNVETQFNSLRHGIADTFDTISHGISSAWDAIWNNTVGRVKRGIGDVVGWFAKLPGRAISALHGFGHSLASFIGSAFTEMWNAAKHVAGDIWHWLTGWVHDLPGWLRHLLGIHSPSSVFYDIGWQMMKGLEKGIQHAAVHAADAARHEIAHIADIPLNILRGGIPAGSKAISGAVGLGRAMAAQMGWAGTQWDALYQLWQRESGWNRLARNPSSGAYGIPQALPGSKMGPAANPPTSSAAAQIAWGLRYIAQVYGSPVGAWAHEQRFNWYGGGLRDALFDRPTIIGVGEAGPERVNVTPAGRRPASGKPVEIRFSFDRSATTEIERAFVNMMLHYVRISGGGDVQAALGS